MRVKGSGIFYIPIIAVIFILSASNLYAQRKPGHQKYYGLVIGNADYVQKQLSIPDIRFSATGFANAIKEICRPRLVQSDVHHVLTGKRMLNAIKDFVKKVELQSGNKTGFIYYCGHGVANLSGSLYFIPGDLNVSLEDTSFGYLAQTLISIDEIKKIIVEAQLEKVTDTSTRFIILADCCSNEAASKWYNGISFHFDGNTETTITYNDSFVKNIENVNSDLRATADLSFDTTGHIVIPPMDTFKGPAINESGFVGELIRSGVFEAYNNKIYYSSAMGEETEMVESPLTKGNPSNYKVGPICRRTLMYFLMAKKNSFSGYLESLTDRGFDTISLPVISNPSRNTGVR
jgi:hypothetical protein